MKLLRWLALILLLLAAVWEPETPQSTDWDAMGFFSAWESSEVQP